MACLCSHGFAEIVNARSRQSQSRRSRSCAEATRDSHFEMARKLLKSFALISRDLSIPAGI
jgi:hypothetical protein